MNFIWSHTWWRKDNGKVCPNLSLSDARVEVDAFAKTSPFFVLDPRIKLLSTIAIIVIIATVRKFEAIAMASLFTVFLVISSKIPLSHLFRNFALALIFIIFASVSMFFYKGWENALIIGIRISLCVIILLLLVTTTPFHKMLRAMRYLHMPRVLATLLMFTYRFIFLFLEELERMKLARLARGFTGGRHLFDKHALRTLSNTIGMIFVRANLRATNIYDALLLRGYSGEMGHYEKMKIGFRDMIYLFFISLAATTIVFMELGVIDWML
ncbi:MAG: cobalt ECF transporter T component CbiQ [Methanomassiliicoccales archaeon]